VVEAEPVAKPDEARAEKAEPKPEPPAQGPAPPDALAPPPNITKEEFEEDIQREAARKEAERRKLEDLEPQLRTWELVELLRKNEADRVPFHNDLRNAVVQQGNKAGPVIEALCERHGRSTFPEIEKRVGRLLATSYGRFGYKAKVAMMRDFGLPETMILDYIASNVDRRSLGTRGGPRSKDEVWVHAARLLLTMPPSPPAKAQSGRRTAPLATSHPKSNSPSQPVPAAGGRAQ
jgi:hypothetical protein